MSTQLDYRRRWHQSGGSLFRYEHIQDLDYYEKIFGWFDFADLYDRAVAEARDGAVFVEIGCFLGRSTAYLGSRVAKAKKRISIAAVDPFLGYSMQAIPKSIFGEFLTNMMKAGLIDIVTPLRMMSADASQLFGDQSIDFCFIDGDHTYEAVSEDIRKWYPKLRVGSMIGGHDYINAEHPGVKQAVDEFFGEKVQVSGISWHTRKS